MFNHILRWKKSFTHIFPLVTLILQLSKFEGLTGMRIYYIRKAIVSLDARLQMKKCNKFYKIYIVLQIKFQ